MVRKLGNSKIVALLMAFILILNTLTPMTVVFAEDPVTEFNTDGIRNAELIDVENKDDEGEPVKYDGVIESVSEGKEENLITFDLSDVYETEDLFIGFKHEFYLESDEDIAILNKDDKEINVKEGYTEFFEKANEPYKIKLQKEDEEAIEYIVLVKTGDYIEEPELNEVEKFENKTFNHGTTKNDLIEELPKELTLYLNNSKTQKVNVEWDFTSFVENQAGEFTLTGDYDLPEKIKGEKLPVEVKIIILEKIIETAELEELIKTAKGKSAKNYTEASFKDLKKVIDEAEVVVKSNDELLIANALINLQTAINKLVISDGVYEFDKETGTITKYNGNQTKVVIPEEIDGVEVREIGTLAFGEKALAGKKINKVTIPNTVKKIDERAFYRAYLTEVILSNNLTDIGLEAFKHNEIEKIVIPESVRTIQKGAFESNKLIDVTLPNELTNIKAEAFKDNNITGIVLPTALTEIGTSAFASNEIKELNIPANLKEIKGFANNKLTEITIPNTVKKIGKAAFASNNFDSIEIPNSVTHIGDLAFSDVKLNTLIMGNSIQKIGEKAFLKNNLKELKLPKSIERIKAQAFADNKFSNESVKIDKKQSEVSIASDSFKSGIPIFLKDVEENLAFEVFDIVITDNKNFITKGNENKNQIDFNETLNFETQDLIRNGDTSFKIELDSKMILSINGVVQTENPVYIKVNSEKSNIFTLEKHGVKKDYTVNLDGLFIDKKSLKEQLAKANDLIDSSLLTDDSEVAIAKASREAQAIYDLEEGTQEKIDQTISKLKSALQSKEFILEVNLDGEITKYNGTKAELIIPSYLGDTKITQINANVFANSDLKKIVIPETIELIEENAFANNTIEEIEFEVNQLINIMQKYDYFGLNQLTGLTIKSEAFKNNNLTEVYLPYQVKELEDEAFADNNFKLFSVEIDNYKSKVTLGEKVFDSISPTFLKTHMNEVDKTYLAELLDQDMFIKSSEYTNESFNKYQTAYEEGLIVLEGNSTNEEVAQAIEKLLQTKQGLETQLGYTTEDLEELIELIRNLDLRDFNSTTEELWETIEIIENNIEDFDQDDINQYYQELNDLYKEFVTPGELFGYKILNNHEIAIVEYRGSSSTLIIPTEIDGKKVTQITSKAFKNKGLNIVSIPETVYQMDSQAFADNLLKTIQLPESLKELGIEAFKNNKLEKIAIPGRLEVIANQTFARNSGLKEVYLGEGVKEINYLAFAQSRIDTVYFPKSLEKIGELAFAKNKITEVHLLENVVEIGASAFQENKIEAGHATINNLEANVQEGKHAFANNGLKSNKEIELIYNGIEETTIEIDPVANIEVEFNTALSEVEKNLPQEIEIKINQSIKTRTMNSEVVEISWLSETYNQTEPGTYEFVGVYELLDTILADKPEVNVQVTVLAEKTDMSELEAAIKYGEEVDSDSNATVKEVAFAIQNINDKLKPFKPDNNLSELEQLIEDAKNINLTNQTADSIENLDEAIKSSEAVIKDEYITQVEVDQAVIQLQAAIDGLQDIPVDFSKLETELKKAEKADTTGKTAASVQALAEAIQTAEAILGNDASSEDEVNKATQALNKALAGLTDQVKEDPVDTSVLASVLKKAKKADTTGKTAASVQALAEAIQTAEAILGNDASSEDEVNKATQGLNKALAGLTDQVKEDPVDTSVLASVLKKAEKADTTGKTAASVQALAEAIQTAEAILGNDASSEDEVNKATQALNKALAGLTDQVKEEPVDTSVLASVLKKAKKADTRNKTTDSIKKLTQSIKSSEAILKDKSATQNEVNEAVKDLKAGINGLVDQPTKKPVDKSELTSTLEKVDATNKPTNTVKKLADLIKEAEAIQASETSTQKEIDIITEKLSEAIKELSGNEALEVKIKNEKDEKLPSTATNIFDLFALGLILIISGLLFIRKRKVN